MAEGALLTSYFGGKPPLPPGVGYMVVLGFGAIFSLFTTFLVLLRRYMQGSAETSEHFNTAGRMVKTGLTASVIVSQWTWAATLLQSSNVAWQYGVSGPFWYASGATIQILLFGVIAISLKRVAPNAHTMCEIVRARWGKTAHLTFLFFSFCASIIVTSMLLLGGAATVKAMTGMNIYLASFLIPWGVIIYTVVGGLHATFVASYIHTSIIYCVLVMMILVVYIKKYSSDEIYDRLASIGVDTPEGCTAYFDENFPTYQFDEDTMACGPVEGNYAGAYLTMISSGGLMFGICNIVGNFGTVFVDQSYWQSAIAAQPTAAARGYLLGGICWFSIPFSLATSLGLASIALRLPITAEEAGSGLVPPAVADYLLGTGGCVAMLVMLFMAIVSTGSAESIAVSSLIAYDIYREYINPNATGQQILWVSRCVIVVFGLFMGGFAIALHAMKLNLGWVYMFMGIIIGSAVIPIWNMMTWDKASGKGAVISAWSGLVLALTSWFVCATIQSGSISVATLGKNEPMFTGNVVAICSSGLIHYIYSKCFDNECFDFSTLNGKLTLVENDLAGLGEKEMDKEMLDTTYRWITVRGWLLTIILAVVWPLVSIPAKVFSKDYFTFWVLIAVVWGFTAAFVCIFLPVYESMDAMQPIFDMIKKKLCCGKDPIVKDEKDSTSLEKESLEEAVLE